MKLGEIIKVFRKKNEMTMQEFADRAGLSKGYISMLEKSQHPQSQRRLVPSFETYLKVASAMSMSIDELVALLDDNETVRLNESSSSSLCAALAEPKIGKIIKEARLDKGYTQEELASKVGVQKSAIAKWENGRVSEIKRSNLKALAVALELDPNVLLSPSDSDLSQPSSSAPTPERTEQEAMLLLAFRKLNGEGKTKVVEYTKDLSKMEKYQDSSPIKGSFEYPSFGAAPALAAEAGSEYSSDLEAQLRKDADEIVRNEYENAAKSKSIAK